MCDKILEIKQIYMDFNLNAGFFARNEKRVYAVNDLSFTLEKGKTYGIVGESGCGKTTTARLVSKMYKPTSGEILYFGNKAEGENIFSFNKKESKAYLEKVKYVFQDPSRSLNPRMNIETLLTSGLKFSSLWNGKEAAKQKAAEALKEVGLNPDDLSRHPQEFSGGQRQRISIARGLIMEPEILICDEVVSALDVSVQGQIINLLSELKEKRNLSYIFITHDLRVATYFCDTIGVMYRGKLVEEGPAENFWKDCRHPYTKLLFEGAMNTKTQSSSEVRSVLNMEEGCPFYDRCPVRNEKCQAECPDFSELSTAHKARCFCL
ncbi:MAG: ABC transporter ATP-binding protein [Treponema sp.]|nr:ABC transporter ATP-binding protein [Treponema sp.]